jgi:hypothetical protein
MTALTIAHEIPAPLQVVPDELGLAAQNLTQAAKVLEIVDAATYEAGNGILIRAHATLKALETERVRLKRPITDLGKAIDGVVASVAEPLEVAKKAMQAKVARYAAAEQAKADALRREAEAKAQQEREAAERERQRLQAIADEEHRQQVAAAHAKAKAEAAELEAVLGQPVEAVAVAVAAAPVIVAAEVATPAIVAPRLAKSAVQTVSVETLVVIDAGMLATWLVANGRAALVEFKMRDIRAIVDAGVSIPGLGIETREQTRMARG